MALFPSSTTFCFTKISLGTYANIFAGVSGVSRRGVRLTVNSIIRLSKCQTYVLDNKPMHMRIHDKQRYRYLFELFLRNYLNYVYLCKKKKSLWVRCKKKKKKKNQNWLHFFFQFWKSNNVGLPYVIRILILWVTDVSSALHFLGDFWVSE